MKKTTFFFSESKDQSIPFALPALRSYKQNLLFPDLFHKTNTNQLPLLDSIHPTKSSSNPRTTKNPKPSQTSAKKPPSTTPQKFLPPSQSVSKKHPPGRDPKKPQLASRSTEPIRQSKEGPKKTPALSEKPKKNEGSQNSVKPNLKPESARVALRKPPSDPVTYNESEKKRSYSISSSRSIKSALKSPRINTNSSGLGEIESIPEFPNKKGRSLTRKRARKGEKESYFNFDPVNFRMSDISIYPLF